MCLKFQLTRTSARASVAVAMCWASTRPFWTHDAFSQVCFGQRTRFRGEFQEFNVLRGHRQQDVANRLWCGFQFGQSEI